MYKLSKYLGHSVTGINLPYFAHLHGAVEISVAVCEQRYAHFTVKKYTFDSNGQANTTDVL